MTELVTDDLRFGATEAADLLRQGFGLDLPPAELDALTSRTAGWVTGLQLAGLALKGHPAPATTIAGLGHDRSLRDYLLTEVIAHQPAAVREFLLDTIGLDRLTAPLCDAVTGRPDGALMLERLETANLFLTPLDPQRQWYHYHPLVAEVVRWHLQQTRPVRLARTHRRAAAWYDTNGLVGEAIDHALAAGDHERALDCLELAADRLLQQAAAGAILRWVQRLPADLVRRRARVCVAVGWALLTTGQFAAVETWALAAETALGLSAETATVARGQCAWLIRSV